VDGGHELTKFIDKGLSLSDAMKAEWKRTKERGAKLYDPKKGGSYEIFNERPLKPEIVEYCAQDVTLLPELWDAYNTKLRPLGQAFWRSQVKKATEDRIKLSQSPTYDGQAKNKVCGPWDEWSIERDRDEWNDDVIFMMNAKLELDDNDCWVPRSTTRAGDINA
jgi:exonuclease 3'-5' domain-containing protein 1